MDLIRILDLPPGEVVTRARGWGFDADSNCVNFTATVWLDGFTIQFSPRYLSSPYVGCDIVPTRPPEECRLTCDPGMAPSALNLEPFSPRR